MFIGILHQLIVAACHLQPVAFVDEGNTVKIFSSFEMKLTIVLPENVSNRQGNFEGKRFTCIGKAEVMPVNGPGNAELML